jgi:hypothetical protein
MRIIILLASLALAACGGPTTPSPPPDTPGSHITSTDFVLLPCGPVTVPNPCVLVMAGGKRVLFGTPAGVAVDMPPEHLRNLDAVMLFSLRGDDIEGLDDIRNASWRAGHETPLRVSGPVGTSEVLSAINKAYEVSDSFTFVEQAPAGGFNAAVLRPLPGEKDTKTRVFDTGDLVVTHLVNDTGRVGYWIDYNGVRLVLEPCGMTQATQFSGESRLTVACQNSALTWPIPDVVFVDRGAAESGPEAP